MVKLPQVALIGRANVGKSTLFNTLTEEKKAIVSNIPGTTRDRNYAKLSWNGVVFQLIDTGGVDIVHDQAFEEDVIKQAKVALNEADLVLFLVDVKDGLMPQDKEVAKLLRKARKPVILVANKEDSPGLKKQVVDFYRLGLKEPMAISALNGSGTGDLLDQMVSQLKPGSKLETEEGIKVAIIGKPNVGKSSIINAILGEERVIVSPTPYTTRDSQGIELTYQEQPYVLVDTAGIRKHAKIKDRLEKYSVAQSLRSIGQSDVSLLVTDVSEPLSFQDQHLADEIMKSSASVLIIANKWDLIPDKDEKTINKFIKYYQTFFPYLAYAPIVFTSALEGQRVKKILEVAREVYQERFREITDNALEKFLKSLMKKHPPARGKGTNHPRLYGLKQLSANPPEFELVKDLKSDLHISYIRFMENQLREKFGFLGTPVIIKVRKLAN